MEFSASKIDVRIAFRSLRISLLTLGILGHVMAQQAKSQAPGQKTFTSPDGVFQFIHPSWEKRYTPAVENAATQLSYIPVCLKSAIVCVAYPETKYPGTTFEAASFQVLEVNGLTTETQCLTPPMETEADVPGARKYPAFKIPSGEPKRLINGTSFLHGVAGSVGLGHEITTDLYRAFHRGKCYELSINIATTNIGVYEPGMKEFTWADAQHLRHELEGILNSFKFLK